MVSKDLERVAGNVQLLLTNAPYAHLGLDLTCNLFGGLGSRLDLFAVSTLLALDLPLCTPTRVRPTGAARSGMWDDDAGDARAARRTPEMSIYYDPIRYRLLVVISAGAGGGCRVG